MLNKLFGLGLAVVPRPLLIRLSLFAQPLMRVLFRGDRYTDPIDNRSFRRFYPTATEVSAKMCSPPLPFRWSAIAFSGSILKGTLRF